jgi:peroxiredoxin
MKEQTGRSWKRPFLMLGGMAVLVMFSLGPGGTPARAEGAFGDEKFKAGDKSADFTLQDIDGSSVTLSSFLNKQPVLLNFWGLRCGACIEEMPLLNAIYHKYKGKGLAVLGVNTDGVGPDIVRATMKEVNLIADFTLLLDTEFAVTDTYTNFLVPLTLVIDKEGIVQYIHTGYEKGDEKKYEQAVVKALGL